MLKNKSYKTISWPSVVLPGVTFSPTFKGNSLYPSGTELDFIVCFRAVAVGTNNQSNYTSTLSSNTALGVLISTGVLHALVFQGGLSNET